MNKKEIKEEVISYQQDILHALKQTRDSYNEVSDLDENETRDMEDFSHQNESNELKRRLDIQIQKAENELNYVMKLSDDTTSLVGPGSLLVTDGPAFYISIPSHSFEVEGKRIICLSEEAPIASVLMHKKVGETIKLGKQSHEITDIK